MNNKDLYNILGILSFVLMILFSIFGGIYGFFYIFSLVSFIAFVVFFILYLKEKIRIRNSFELRDETYIKDGYKKYYDEVDERLFIDEKKKKIVYMNIKENDRILKYNDILKCELIENGLITKTISKKHASLGKAIIGDALFGPVGAIVGGLSGTTVSNSNTICNELRIKVTVNKLEDPVFFITLFKMNLETNSKKYAEYYNEAQRILSIFEVILNNK